MMHSEKLFVSLALGCVFTLLVGCGGDSTATPTYSGTGTTPVAPQTTANFYVSNESMAGIPSLLQFSKAATGTATPVSSLALPAGFSTSTIATDPAGQIYVGGSQSLPGSKYQWEVLVYAAKATGNAAPVRTILGTSASFETLLAITVDSAGQLYVSGRSSTYAALVAVFAAGADGAAIPIRLIAGNNTGLGIPDYGLAVDSVGNLYTANSNTKSVKVYAPNSTGDVAPIRTIAGSNTGFNSIFGMTTDASDNLYLLSVTEIPGVSAATVVEEFSPTASGNVAPVRTIGGSATGLGYFASLIRVDSTGTIFVAGDGPPNTPFVLSFAALASGNVAPLTSLTSTGWVGPGYNGFALQ